MDTPLINKITNKQTNKQKITIKKNDLPSRVFEVFKTRRKKQRHLKVVYGRRPLHSCTDIIRQLKQDTHFSVKIHDRQPDTVNRWPVFDVGRLDLSV